MANLTYIDTLPAHNAVVEVNVADTDTFTFDTRDLNDYVKVSGEGDVFGKLGAGNDSFFADAHYCGNATVDGGSGADTIVGGHGDDHLSGGRDQDILIGGAGNDWLFGGQGHDVLTGGAGSDTFVNEKVTVADGGYSPLGGKGYNVDIITDYDHCDKPLEFNGWGAGLHWDSGHANFLDGANNVVQHMTGLEGVDLVRTAFDAAHLHQEWFFA
jgi:Ca2+-binding RTX toxin-like protein